MSNKPNQSPVVQNMISNITKRVNKMKKVEEVIRQPEQSVHTITPKAIKPRRRRVIHRENIITQ